MPCDEYKYKCIKGRNNSLNKILMTVRIQEQKKGTEHTFNTHGVHEVLKLTLKTLGNSMGAI